MASKEALIAAIKKKEALIQAIKEREAQKAIPMAQAEGRMDAQGNLSQAPIVDEESFKRQRENFGRSQAVVPETSRLEQGAAAVMRTGATMNPFTDEIAGGIRSVARGTPYEQELAAVRESQQLLADRNPNADLIGTGAGIAGSVMLGGANIARQAGVNAAQMAGASEGDLMDRTIAGAYGAAMPYAIKGAGMAVSKVASKLPKPNLADMPQRTMKALQQGMKRLGFDESEIREAAEQAARADVIPDGNPLAQMKLLYDEGILKGANTTKQLASKMSKVLKENTDKVAKIVGAKAGTQPINSAIAPVGLPFNENLVQSVGAPQLAQRAVALLQKKAPQLLDDANNLRALPLKQAQAVKQVLQDSIKFGRETGLDEVDQQILKTVELHLRNGIEEAAPAIGRLNKVSSAIQRLQENVIKLENKGVDVSQGRLRQTFSRTLGSPFTTGAAGAGLGALIGPQVGMDARQGALMGASIGAGVRATQLPRSLQDSLSPLAGPKPSMLPRNVDAIGKFLNDNAAQLSAPLVQYLNTFNTLPPKQKEQAMPQIIDMMKQSGIQVESPVSGYPSEINGRLTSPEDVIAAGQELWKRSDLSILEKSKMWNNLNKDGTVPKSQVQSDESLMVEDKLGRLIKITEGGSYGI